MDKPLHSVTPLYHSKRLSEYTPGHQIYLKLESFQPSKSFKMRGIGLQAQKAKENGATHLVMASGGNAGIALAHASKILNIPNTIFVAENTHQEILDRLKTEEANVVQCGKSYADAAAMAKKENGKPGVVLVHSYDNEWAWEGNSTIIDEIYEQIPEKPVAIVTTVGGGGLLMGILIKLQKYEWDDIPILVFEPIGSNCFHQSVKANKVVTLKESDTIIQCLNGPSIPEKLFAALPKFNVISNCITDKQALEACIRFANDELLLVDPACGAGLAAVYSKILPEVKINGKPLPEGPVVIVVCGGSTASLSLVEKWKRDFDIEV